MQPWNGSGRLWTALTGSKLVWTVLEGSGRLWEASNNSRELIRSLRDVRNHAPTAAGKHILLNRCFASPKRARWRKSQNRVVTIGDSTIFNIRHAAMGCYDGIWKCRNRLPTIGKETILNIQHGSPCGCRNRRFSKIVLFPLVRARFLRYAKARWAVTFASRNAEIGFPPLVRRRFLNVQHGSSCECRNRCFFEILIFPLVGIRFLRYAKQ